ncbi:hypothetical protein HYS11_01045 [Candidatus Gottesmanbacteria bacterium]|nr:hypothetical protein [Candidatus Gottesmanbacteria bacterium]
MGVYRRVIFDLEEEMKELLRQVSIVQRFARKDHGFAIIEANRGCSRVNLVIRSRLAQGKRSGSG